MNVSQLSSEMSLNFLSRYFREIITRQKVHYHNILFYYSITDTRHVNNKHHTVPFLLPVQFTSLVGDTRSDSQYYNRGVNKSD